MLPAFPPDVAAGTGVFCCFEETQILNISVTIIKQPHTVKLHKIAWRGSKGSPVLQTRLLGFVISLQQRWSLTVLLLYCSLGYKCIHSFPRRAENQLVPGILICYLYPSEWQKCAFWQTGKCIGFVPLLCLEAVCSGHHGEPNNWGVSPYITMFPWKNCTQA